MGKILKIGVDEAGRGPIAGPVLAAAVIIDQKISGVKDSKKLSEPVREKLYKEIIDKSVAYGIGFATVEEIEEFNILNATLLAMGRAIKNLKVAYEKKFSFDLKNVVVLIDGNRTIPGLYFNQRAIVDGDNLIYEISCASILAKVTRDRIMRNYAKIYPQFGFEKNKGYGTQAHFEAIAKFGIIPGLHRKSFLQRHFYNESLFG